MRLMMRGKSYIFFNFTDLGGMNFENPLYTRLVVILQNVMCRIVDPAAHGRGARSAINGRQDPN